MQRTTYNVWGRELQTREAANERALKALADNPKIQNLHIAIIPREHHYWAIGKTATLYRYQARWYDRKVAIKAGKARRLRDAEKPAPHYCNCEYCDR